MDIKTIITVIGGVIGFIYIGSLVRVMWYERKINKLNDELSEKIEYERRRPQSMVTIDGRINHLKTVYNPQIADLERKRRFILEKLPFIKQ